MNLITRESFSGDYLTHLEKYKEELYSNGYYGEAEEVQLEIDELRQRD